MYSGIFYTFRLDYGVIRDKFDSYTIEEHILVWLKILYLKGIFKQLIIHKYKEAQELTHPRFSIFKESKQI